MTMLVRALHKATDDFFYVIISNCPYHFIPIAVELLWDGPTLMLLTFVRFYFYSSEICTQKSIQTIDAVVRL